MAITQSGSSATYSLSRLFYQIRQIENRVSILSSGTGSSLTKAQADTFYKPIDYVPAFSVITGKPTTLSGYGITDAFTQSLADARYRPISYVPTFASITSKPTTISGYGITDAFTQTTADALYKSISYVPTFAEITSKPTTIAGYGITGLGTMSTQDANAVTITGGTITGITSLTATTATAGTNTTQVATTAFVITERINTSVLTNKTLTSPKILGGDGIFNAAGEKILGIEQASPTGNVNRLSIKGALTGSRPELQATGSDTDIDIGLVTKGIGGVRINGNWIAQSNYFYNVKEDGKTIGGPNAVGNGTTDDSNALQFAVYAGSGATNKIIYLPAGTYLIKSPINISGDVVTFKGAGIGKTFIKVAADYSGTDAPFIAYSGRSDITFEDLSITGNAKQVSAAVQINSFNSASTQSKRIRFERVRIYNFWGAGISFGNTTSSDTHSLDEITIKDCHLYNIGNPSIPITYIDTDVKYDAIYLGMVTRKITITNNYIYNVAGDGIFGWGQSQTAFNEDQGNTIISSNNISRCWMGIEINGNALGKNLKIDANIIKFSTRNAGYLISVDSDLASITNNTLVGIERGLIEYTGIGGIITGNTGKIIAYSSTSGGVAATVLTTRVQAIEAYGFANKITNNNFQFDRTGASATTPTEFNGIHLVSRTTDLVSQPNSYDGVTDLSGYWEINNNKIHGFTHRAILAEVEKIRKVNITNNTFLSRITTVTPIRIYGYDWVIQNNIFDLKTATPTNNLNGVVALFTDSQNEQTNSIVTGNTIINDTWRILNPNGYFSDYQNNFQTVGGTSYILKDFPEVTQAQRNAITTPIAGMVIYQTDNTPGRYRYSGSSWTIY